MPASTLVINRTFHHLFILAFLLGAQFYQSFFANITAVRALSRPQFRILQASIWPMYFKLQTALCVLLALTRRSGLGGGGGKGQVFSRHGMLAAKGDRWTVTVPLIVMIVFAATNMLFLVPTTHRYVGKVHMVSVREEKANGKDGVESAELKRLRLKFTASHGASYVFNMAVLVTSVWYAVCMAERSL